MNAATGNKSNKIVTALLAIVLLGLAGCAGAPPAHLSTDEAKAQYGAGAMRSDNYANSG